MNQRRSAGDSKARDDRRGIGSESWKKVVKYSLEAKVMGRAYGHGCLGKGQVSLHGLIAQP